MAVRQVLWVTPGVGQGSKAVSAHPARTSLPLALQPPASPEPTPSAANIKPLFLLASFAPPAAAFKLLMDPKLREK
ncbi:hypothetical protein M7I_0788 [Glarea lozoyensis 74030]|uniref:Uncharacterized protein n=1 Tax=Glarea lozoyensis (strain ATCC 74030 / MF5533) TaxID=1104152 RepID=H0EEB4_GLAL7|nr:hypothetical protein M7I_0788 [Glarea lozoyensis 74030]